MQEYRPARGASREQIIAELRSLGRITPSLKMLKSEEQIAGCIEAGRINSLILDRVAAIIAPGISTGDIDDLVAEQTRLLGGRPATLGFQGFPKSVCTSVNDVICHGIPSHSRVLKEGDILNVDCTTVVDGYYGDASRMFRIGEVSEEADRLIRLTESAVERAVASLAPYTSTLGDIGHVIHTMASAAGYSVVREIGGHGVGLAMHEEPYVCHIGTAGAGVTLMPGMIFTVEPMINMGNSRFYVDKKDGWTVRTADGRLSAQVEYEVLITEEGHLILSK